MSQHTTVFRHLQPWLQAARGLLPRSSDAAADLRPVSVTMEPYMDALPTRRPSPRAVRARRLRNFMPMSIDA